MQLVELDLGDVGMTDVGVDAFVTLLSHGVLWDLECLSLSQNDITEKGALAFMSALMAGIGCRLSVLRKLKFGRLKKMGEGRLVLLAAGLRQCHQLEEWDMDSEYETSYTITMMKIMADRGLW